MGKYFFYGFSCLTQIFFLHVRIGIWRGQMMDRSLYVDTLILISTLNIYIFHILDIWKDGRMEGWTNGWTDGWTDRRMDGGLGNVIGSSRLTLTNILLATTVFPCRSMIFFYPNLHPTGYTVCVLPPNRGFLPSH